MSTSLGCIIPARNEGGHLFSVVEQANSINSISEIVIIEGGSTDDTWLIAQKIQSQFPTKVKIAQQEGKGKFDAVLLGSKLCTTDSILIWDADGTVSLKDTLRIITIAQQTGLPVIGDRLRGNIAKGAMQTANWVGNWVFAILWSPITCAKPTDMLCGTKIFPRIIYSDLPNWLVKNDPYGDFALVAFARAKEMRILSCIVDYTARSYGVTNINRWSGGMQLLKTTVKVYLGFASKKILKKSPFHEE